MNEDSFVNSMVWAPEKKKKQTPTLTELANNVQIAGPEGTGIPQTTSVLQNNSHEINGPGGINPALNTPTPLSNYSGQSPALQNNPHEINGPGGINPALNTPTPLSNYSGQSPTLQNNPHEINGPGGIDPTLNTPVPTSNPPGQSPVLQDNPHEINGPGGIDPTLNNPKPSGAGGEQSFSDPLTAYQATLKALPQGKSEAPWGGTITRTGDKFFWEGDNNTGAPVGFEMRLDPAKEGLQSLFVNSGIQDYIQKQMGDQVDLNKWYAQQMGFGFDALGNITDGSPGMGSLVSYDLPTSGSPGNQSPTSPSPAGPLQKDGPGGTVLSNSESPQIDKTSSGSLNLYGTDISDKGPKSYSGLPEGVRDSILSKLAPQMVDAAGNYTKNIDDSAKAAAELYQTNARAAMQEGAQSVLNDLANKGILNSSEGNNRMSSGMAKIANEVASKGFAAAEDASRLKANEATMLSNLVNLGKYSSNKNDLAPFTLMSNIYDRMMG